jgi:alpha-glucuronidase
MACVSNFGAYSNWTGHVLAGSNSYGFGRLSWSGGSLTSEEINREW